MNLQAQIELITVPQDFTRLCNAVLQAEHGPDFLPIDDDRADRGNDGYLKSQKRMFAAHCFKRIQNQRLDNEIRTKMLGDLQKAIILKAEGKWEIEAWTFLSNYPIPEGIAVQVVLAGKNAGIDVSWSGPSYFAEVLQRLQSVREQFHGLLANDVLNRLDSITDKLNLLATEEVLVNWVPRTSDEQTALIAQKPPAWEYLLFAGVLYQGKLRLEPKWRDYQSGHGRRTGRYLDDAASRTYLRAIWSDVMRIISGMMMAFDKGAQVEAFGAPGEPGNAELIEHIAGRIISSYEELLDWANELRGTVYPQDVRESFRLASLVADQPAAEVREFIDQTVVQVGDVPRLLALPNPDSITISVLLEVTVDQSAIDAFMAETERLNW